MVRSVLIKCIALLLTGFARHAVARMRSPPLKPWQFVHRPSLEDAEAKSRMDMCKVHWRDTTLDHFSWV